MRVRPQRPIKECRCISTCFQAIKRIHKWRRVKVFRIRRICIHRTPICIYNRPDIVFGSITPLYLQRIRCGRNNIRQPWHQAQVFGIHNICATFVFFDWHFNATVAFTQNHIVFPTTQLGTRPAICRPSRNKVRQQTPPRIRHTHRPVDKDFQPHIRTRRPNRLKLGVCHLSCQNT